MKVVVGVVRIFVGVLFIISGFIKLNDPVGFSYKLAEYFAEGVLNMEFLIPFALLIAIFVVIYEVVLGIMLIIGFAPKFTLWSLIGMITFFTFLTFYSAYFNKVTDCGCFGDAMKLTPWESFTKDIVLLGLILLLFFQQKFITALIPKLTHKWIVFGSFTACLAFAYYVLMHLPAIDFRAYEIGKNIQAGMEIPEGAPLPKFEYNWKFEEQGTEKIISTGGNYPTTSGKFISVETITLEEGYEPPIHDFSIEKEGTDYTSIFLEKEKVVMIVAYNLAKSEVAGMQRLKEVVQEAKLNGYSVLCMSASGQEGVAKAKTTYGLDFDFYFCDETTLKTMVRSNPGIMVLRKGTITQKLHWNDADALKF